MSYPRIAAVMVVATAMAASPAVLAKKKPKAATIAAPQMDESLRVAHALNRFTFGPRPGDVSRVAATGLDKWFEQQLNPGKIDDSALQARLSNFRTLEMSPRELAENFPPPQLIKAVMDGKVPMPSDPRKRAIYQAQIDAYKQRQENKAEKNAENNGQANGDAAANANGGDGEMAPGDDISAAKAARRENRMQANQDAERLLDLPPTDRYNAVLKLPAGEREALVKQLKEPDRARLVDGMTPEQRETLISLVAPQRVVVDELSQAKLLRAIYSDRQLEEVMTDFWFNHFNVYLDKGADRFLVTSYERDAIRAHALGKFKDLLMATATHPAMMFYLDNFQSVGPDSDAGENGGRGRRNINRNNRRMRVGFGQGPFARFPQQRRMPPPRQPQTQTDGQQRPKRGLNENYAREVMELHTLGVDGGYTQQDVTELAKVLTGWTIKEPRRGGGFEFNPRMHEPGEKLVLGHKIKEDGENEGRKMLDILAHHPSTAHFISKKLAMRFVSDDPPPALVDRMAQTFLATDGDIKEVLRTLFHSPEFWAPEAYRAKVKTPLEFVASAARATNADVKDAAPLANTLQRMGMPLYRMQPPTGYSMKADAWVNSAALLDRMNFSLALGAGKLRGVDLDASRMLPASSNPQQADEALNAIVGSLLNGDVSAQTRSAIEKQLQDPQLVAAGFDARRPQNLNILTGLVLGSPEFQRR